MNDCDTEVNRLDLSIVVPFYNEQQSVAPLVKAIAATFPPAAGMAQQEVPGNHGAVSDADHEFRYELILVDDGSTDETYAEAVASARVLEVPVRVLSLQRNYGQTAAMQAGIDAAEGRLIATLDGDLQNDPRDLPRMIACLEKQRLDLLVGRRKDRQDGRLLRKIPSWIANRLIAAVTGVRVRDYGCTLKVYRASVIKQVRLMGEMHRFIPAWMASVTDPSRIGEIDVNHRARQFGTSKYGISRTIRVVLDLLSVVFFMKFRARPGHFFGSLGLLVGAMGTAMLGTVFVSKYGMGRDIGTRPMLLLGVTALLSSLQLICFGVMSEMLSRVPGGAINGATYLVRECHASDVCHREAAVVAISRGLESEAA